MWWVRAPYPTSPAGRCRSDSATHDQAYPAPRQILLSHRYHSGTLSRRTWPCCVACEAWLSACSRITAVTSGHTSNAVDYCKAQSNNMILNIMSQRYTKWTWKWYKHGLTGNTDKSYETGIEALSSNRGCLEVFSSVMFKYRRLMN